MITEDDEDDAVPATAEDPTTACDHRLIFGPDRYGRTGWETVMCATCRRFLGYRPVDENAATQM